MPSFKYKARDGRGELITGVLNAPNVEEAGRMLRGDGKFVVKIDKAREAASPGATTGKSSNGKIRRAEIITFAHQLAVMVETGVPISEALECVAQQSENETFRAVLKDISDQVQAGNDLSSALRSHAKVFPPVMTSLIRASEVSGTMGRMLDRVSGYLSKEMQTAKKIRGALTYPAFMLGMVILVTTFLLMFVLPKFAGIYQSRDTALPAPTQILLGLSGSLVDNWHLWLGGIIMAVAGVYFAAGTPGGQRFYDYLKLHTPVIGPLFNKLYLTRGCRTMGTMVAAGVPILDMIEIVREVTNNALYEELWDDADLRLRQGAQLSDSLFDSPLIPRSVAQMVYSGERSGRIGDVMERIAEYTESDFDEQIKTTTGMIEPVMTATMGVIIGFVAIAMLLPIFSVGKVVSGG
ncbi:MAG: type II secretion system F family protein [Phycisphaerales bacterium]